MICSHRPERDYANRRHGLVQRPANLFSFLFNKPRFPLN